MKIFDVHIVTVQGTGWAGFALPAPSDISATVPPVCGQFQFVSPQTS
jgi:hypothetical protein